MYQLVAIDLDGTLLNTYGQVSEKNRNAIKEMQEKGIEVVIASGRPKDSVINFAQDLGIDNYCICGNGSLLYDIGNEKNLYDKFIQKQKALQIIEICKKNSIYFSVYTEQFILAESLKDSVLVFNNENQNKPESKQTRIKIEPDIYQYISQNNIDILKISISDNNEIIFNRILQELKKIQNVNVLDVEHMSRKTIKLGTTEINMEYYYTEITSQNVDKWDAIRYLAKKLEIAQQDIVAIGDNVNDKEMIQNAGLGVVMGNSAPYIQEIGDVVTLSNQEDGVAYAVHEYILKNELQ